MIIQKLDSVEAQAISQAFPLGRMYGQMFKGIYTELVNSDGLPPEIARGIALELMRTHLEVSIGNKKNKDKDSAESLLSALIGKGGSA